MRYALTFFDYWHMGSGLSSGVKLDSSVIKDDDGIAFVPGKTIKGLLHEMARTLNKDFSETCFGTEGNTQGKCHFSNARLEQGTRQHIAQEGLQQQLYHHIASTKIGEGGVAEEGSLREIEVVVPLTLYGEITGCEDKKNMHKAMNMLKRMGLNRNRGLGRCAFTLLGDEYETSTL